MGCGGGRSLPLDVADGLVSSGGGGWVAGSASLLHCSMLRSHLLLQSRAWLLKQRWGSRSCIMVMASHTHGQTRLTECALGAPCAASAAHRANASVRALSRCR